MREVLPYPKNVYLKFILKNCVYSLIVVKLIFVILSYLILFGTHRIGEVGGMALYVDNEYTFNQDSTLKIVEKGVDYLEQKGFKVSCGINIIFNATEKDHKLRSFFLDSEALATFSPFLKTIVVAPVFSVEKQHTTEPIDRSEIFLSRNLSEVLAHELFHAYAFEKYGFSDFLLKRIKGENWKMEGMAEYVANSSSLKVDIGMQMFENAVYEDLNMDIQKDFFTNYFVGRLRSDYLLTYKNVPFEEFWNTNYDEVTLDSEIRTAFSGKKYGLMNQNNYE